ncbi:MAG: hypothetical protein M1818_001837 [Claussenomyces sp. TS43310]|nr:MAG: hypothetical protein M1818_001837 [Claussenomyces sp. TS43310]
MASSTSRPPASSNSGAANGQADRSYFETQRAALLGEIGLSLEHVLQNINKLNRSLESVIAVRLLSYARICIRNFEEVADVFLRQVGNEFGSVEALWSQFENVMGKDPTTDGDPDDQQGEGGEERDDEDSEAPAQ